MKNIRIVIAELDIRYGYRLRKIDWQEAIDDTGAIAIALAIIAAMFIY